MTFSLNVCFNICLLCSMQTSFFLSKLIFPSTHVTNVISYSPRDELPISLQLSFTRNITIMHTMQVQTAAHMWGIMKPLISSKSLFIWNPSDEIKSYILWQDKKTLNMKKKFLCPWPPLSPLLCIVYLHYASTKPSPLAEIPAQP